MAKTLLQDICHGLLQLMGGDPKNHISFMHLLETVQVQPEIGRTSVTIPKLSGKQPQIAVVEVPHTLNGESYMCASIVPQVI
jgi:hypothetical protein